MYKLFDDNHSILLCSRDVSIHVQCMYVYLYILVLCTGLHLHVAKRWC